VSQALSGDSQSSCRRTTCDQARTDDRSAFLDGRHTYCDAHQEYLQYMYQAGTFLLSGRKEPRDGGVILASAESVQALQLVLAQDPFQIHGAASYQIVQFTPTMAGPALQSLVVV